MSNWDDKLSKEELKSWLYGKQSLSGNTRQWLVDEAKKWPEKTKFLDAGCGGGVTGYHFLNNGILDNIKYTGVDFSDCMLDLANEKVVHKNAKFIKSSLEDYTTKRKFDKILLRAVLEHNLDPTNILTNIISKLKQDGILYIIFWNNPVKCDSIIKIIDRGFYDNSHSEKVLANILLQNNCIISNKYDIEEKSFNSNNRIIWEVKFK